MSQAQLPGMYEVLRPVLEHHGYLAVGGFVLLEDFGVSVPGEALLIAAAFRPYRWYVGGTVVVVSALIVRRIRRRQASTQ